MFFYKSVNDNEQIVVADREPSKLPTDVYGDPMALIEDDKEIISRGFDPETGNDMHVHGDVSGGRNPQAKPKDGAIEPPAPPG